MITNRKDFYTALDALKNKVDEALAITDDESTAYSTKYEKSKDIWKECVIIADELQHACIQGMRFGSNF